MVKYIIVGTGIDEKIKGLIRLFRMFLEVTTILIYENKFEVCFVMLYRNSKTRCVREIKDE